MCAGLRWLQLYVCVDRHVTIDMVQRAKAAGYTAIVLTVDRPVLGSLATQHHPYSLSRPPRSRAALLLLRRLNLGLRSQLLREQFELPGHLGLAHFPQGYAGLDERWYPQHVR